MGTRFTPKEPTADDVKVIKERVRVGEPGSNDVVKELVTELGLTSRQILAIAVEQARETESKKVG